jgi:PQQ-dependent catabolism-associated beta-propeller protein
VGIEPEGMAVSPDNKITVATSEATSMAHVIDNATFQVLANILVDTRPREAQFTRNGAHVWVSSEIGGTVSVIDAKSLQIVKKFGFEIPGVDPDLIQPIGIRFTLDGKRAFVALSHANRIAVVDTETHAIERYILVGQRPWHMSLGSDGKKLYVANGLTNDMTVIDVETFKPEKSVPVGRLPWGVAIKPGKAAGLAP